MDTSRFSNPSSELDDLDEIASSEGNTTAIDALVESDEETADIFDDDNEDDPIDMLSKSSTASSKQRAKSPYLSLSGYKNREDEDDDDSISEPDDEKDKSQHSAASGEDYTDDEDEGEDGYKVGGYHPVKLGEIYNQR